MNILLITVSVQLYMLFNFCTFHLARYREKARESGAHDKQNKRKNVKKLAKNDEVILNIYFLKKLHMYL